MLSFVSVRRVAAAVAIVGTLMVGGAAADYAPVADEPEAGGPAAGESQPRLVTLQKRQARPTAEEQIPFGDTGTFGKF